MHTHPPGGLTAYYENNVIGGPGAFVVEAENFESFGQSLISKLIKEIAARVAVAPARLSAKGRGSSHPRHSREREHVERDSADKLDGRVSGWIPALRFAWRE